MPLGGIGDDPQGRKRNIAVRRDLCRDMRFHIDGVGARPLMQRLLARAASDRLVDACKIDQSSAEDFRQSERPGGVGVEPFALCDDRTRDEQRPGRQTGSETSGNAKADDGAASRSCGFFQLALKARAVSSARYDVNLRSRREFRL